LKVKRCLVVVLPVLVAILLNVVGIVYNRLVVVKGMPCWFREFTGYLCAGCGGTRSFYALLHGNILDSFKYNAFVPSMALVGVVMYIRLFAKVICGFKITVLPKNDAWVYVLLVLSLGYFLLRNLC
jgi:hypothetical protein